MNPATATTIPAAPDAFGDAMNADAALAALTNNDIQTGDNEPEPNNGGTEPATAGALATTEKPGDSAGTDSPPTPEKPAKAKPVSKRALARMSKRDVTELYLAEREKTAAAEARVAELAQTASVHTALSADIVDESVQDMCGDVLGLADAAAQISVSEKYAAAVALDDDEMKRLKLLLSRVVKARAGTAVAKAAPEIALAVSVASIALGKYIAYRIARKEAGHE